MRCHSILAILCHCSLACVFSIDEPVAVFSDGDNRSFRRFTVKSIVERYRWALCECDGPSLSAVSIRYFSDSGNEILSVDKFRECCH